MLLVTRATQVVCGTRVSCVGVHRVCGRLERPASRDDRGAAPDLKEQTKICFRLEGGIPDFPFKLEPNFGSKEKEKEKEKDKGKEKEKEKEKEADPTYMHICMHL